VSQPVPLLLKSGRSPTFNFSLRLIIFLLAAREYLDVPKPNLLSVQLADGVVARFFGCKHGVCLAIWTTTKCVNSQKHAVLDVIKAAQEIADIVQSR
jgi:hypothetical protein